MEQTTSIYLGNYFENFVDNIITEGRYKNTNEVILAGLYLLEEKEKINTLEKLLNEGFESGIAKNFNPEKHLEMLKLNKLNG